MLKLIVVLVSVPLVTGCALFGNATDKAVKYGARAVIAYCENVPRVTRDEVRIKVNHRASPHRVEVTCAF